MKAMKEGLAGHCWGGIGTLLIFTRPRGPSIAESNHGALTRINRQGQGLGGEGVHGSWKPLASMVTATGDLKYLVVPFLHLDLLVICEIEQPLVSQEFYLLRQWSFKGQVLLTISQSTAPRCSR